jgi:cytochrome c553
MLVSVPCFLLSLVAGASKAPQGTTATPAYSARCASCHGAAMTGSGAPGPSILAYVRYHTDKDIAALLQSDMHPSPALSDDDLEAVLTDLRSLAGTNPAMATAPDIAGSGLANPTAMFLSGAMMLDWLGERHGIEGYRLASAILTRAVEGAFAPGNLIPHENGGSAGTAEITSRVFEALESEGAR